MTLEQKMKKRIDHNLNQMVKNPYEKKKHKFPLWAKIMIPVTAVTAAVAIPVLLIKAFNLESMINKLNGAYVDMNGVMGFGIGNAPDENGKIAEITRLLGGDEKSGSAVLHAKELIEKAKELKL